jgi:hypothetical protein
VVRNNRSFCCEKKEGENMEEVIVIKDFIDISTGKLIKADPKPIKMPKERVPKQVMLGLVKRVQKEPKQAEKAEETK